MSPVYMPLVTEDCNCVRVSIDLVATVGIYTLHPHILSPCLVSTGLAVRAYLIKDLSIRFLNILWGAGELDMRVILERLFKFD